MNAGATGSDDTDGVVGVVGVVVVVVIGSGPVIDNTNVLFLGPK